MSEKQLSQLFHVVDLICTGLVRNIEGTLKWVVLIFVRR